MPKTKSEKVFYIKIKGGKTFTNPQGGDLIDLIDEFISWWVVQSIDGLEIMWSDLIWLRLLWFDWIYLSLSN